MMTCFAQIFAYCVRQQAKYEVTTGGTHVATHSLQLKINLTGRHETHRLLSQKSKASHIRNTQPPGQARHN
jgi:hypothetical protein